MSADNSRTSDDDRSRFLSAISTRDLYVLALLALLGFAGQWSRPLWEPDEGRYAAVAMQMLRTGDWITPRLAEDLPHLSKPPLTYWAIAASVRLLGASELAVRLPNSIAWTGTLFALYALARFFLPTGRLLAPVVWATSLLPFAAVNIVTTDTLLTCFETLAALGFVLYWKLRVRSACWLMWMSFALAFLVKGPPALLPMLPFIIFATRRGFVRNLIGLPLLASLVAASSWYVAVALQHPNLVNYWLAEEVAGRVAGEFDRNGGWFGWIPAYVPVVLLGMLPWSLVSLRSRWRGTLGNHEDELLLLWIGVPGLVLLVSSSRMPLYLLPLSVPAAILIARRVSGRWPFDRPFRFALAGWCCALLVLRALIAPQLVERDPRGIAHYAAELSRGSDTLYFVDMRPWYGVSVYSIAQAERIQIEPPAWPEPSYAPEWRSLASLMSNSTSSRMTFVVKRKNFERMRNALRADGWDIVDARADPRTHLYVVAAESTHDED